MKSTILMSGWQKLVFYEDELYSWVMNRLSIDEIEYEKRVELSVDQLLEFIHDCKVASKEVEAFMEGKTEEPDAVKQKFPVAYKEFVFGFIYDKCFVGNIKHLGAAVASVLQECAAPRGQYFEFVMYSTGDCVRSGAYAAAC